MFGFTRRSGHTYRIYDKSTGRIAVVALGGAYICDGSHRRPTIDIITRAWYTSCTGQRMCGVNGGKRYRLPLPLVRFTYHRWPTPVGRWIGRVAYRSWHKAIRRLCAAPR